jgi:hypothetical protein
MEKLNKAKQAEIRKLSDARLVGKLTRAGMSEEEIESMDRTALLNSWAEIVASGGKDGPSKPEAAGGGVVYDVELERQRLLLQAKQWEDLAERRTQRELEANRLKEDAAERQAARELEAKRWESEGASGKCSRSIS